MLVLRRLYRATGADLPFGDPRAAHGVAMEGYYWRLTDPAGGRVIVALAGVSRAADGPWGLVALAGHPGGFAGSAVTRTATASGAGLGVTCASALVADERSVRASVDGGALDVTLSGLAGFPVRPFGGLGPAQAVPGLSQYWHPHVLGGRAHGTAVLGDERIAIDGWDVYAEKNWGRGGFPERWWWGQAHGFGRPDVCVAFAGGGVRAGPLALDATALVVRLGTRIVRLGTPLLTPVTADVGGGRWHLRGRGPVWSVELLGEGAGSTPHALPVPLPASRSTVPGAIQHLGASVTLEVRRRGRVVFAGSSALAGLEDGRVDAVAGAARRDTIEVPA